MGGALSWIIAILMGFGIWWITRWIIGLLSVIPPEVDPEALVEIDLDFRCTVCGAEVTLRSVNVEEVRAPKHCREEMFLETPLELEQFPEES